MELMGKSVLHKIVFKDKTTNCVIVFSLIIGRGIELPHNISNVKSSKRKDNPGLKKKHFFKIRCLVINFFIQNLETVTLDICIVIMLGTVIGKA